LHLNANGGALDRARQWAAHRHGAGGSGALPRARVDATTQRFGGAVRVTVWETALPKHEATC
jgi:hypothetical protein